MENKEVDIQESGEMYLETIFVLKDKCCKVRSIDVAEKIGHSKASVSRAVNLLKERGYIVVDEEGFIDFTAKGEARAREIFERHHILTDYLIMLGVDKKTAEADACRIEHIISDQSFEAIKRHSDKQK